MRWHFTSRQRCWFEWAALAFALPALIAFASSLIKSTVPTASHGTLETRFLWSLAGGILAEWIFLAAALLSAKAGNQQLSALGIASIGNWKGWALALSVAALTIVSNLRFFPRMGIPVRNAFVPTGVHLVAALATGITAGVCEEVLFRALLMNDFRSAGYGNVAQVVWPGVAFGFSHLGYTVHGLMAGLGIMLPTAILGMVWGIAYLLGKRSLVPCIAAHFLNDATALSWIGFFMFKGSLG